VFEVDLSPLLSADVKNEGKNIPTPSLRLRGMNREEFNFLNFSCKIVISFRNISDKV
jgi:hypothetical protein